jgi:hypothetical protein
MARFMWAGERDALHCDWNPAGAGDFLAIAAGLSGRFRRLVWFTFAGQCWALWNVRNKLTIEGKLIGNPADAFFQMSIHMQHWRVRPKDHAWLDTATDEARRLSRGLGLDDDPIYILFTVILFAVLARGLASYRSTCPGGTTDVVIYVVLNLLLSGLY